MAIFSKIAVQSLPRLRARRKPSAALGLSFSVFRFVARCGGVIRFSPPPSLFVPLSAIKGSGSRKRNKNFRTLARILEGLAPRFLSLLRIIKRGSR